MAGAMGATTQKRKIHPHKFNMWIAIASIVMMFAGLTSAYIVQDAQENWNYFPLPNTAYYSTIVVFISSITMILGTRAFKQRKMQQFRALITTTLILGIAFCILQYLGFTQLYNENIRIDNNKGASFIIIIAGLHLLHIVGGIIALLIVFFRAFRRNVKIYNATGLEIVGTYWHFVDILWIYLFVFFLANQ